MSRYIPPHEVTSPDDVLTGRCPTCKSVVDVLRANAEPPQSALPLRQKLSSRGSDVGGFGAWKELWSTECPSCAVKASKVTGPDGDVQQMLCGPTIYLVKKGN